MRRASTQQGGQRSDRRRWFTRGRCAAVLMVAAGSTGAWGAKVEGVGAGACVARSCAERMGLPEKAWDAIVLNEPFPGARAAMARDLRSVLEGRPMCFAPDLSVEDWQFIMQTFHGLPPGIPAEYLPQQPDNAGGGGGGAVGPMFFSDATVWTDGFTTLSQGVSGQARAAFLTYSFPADGVNWGTSGSGFSILPNDLTASLQSRFGATDLDEGREWIRQGLAAWSRDSGLRYSEVSDNNTAMGTSTALQSTRGDIRIGSTPFTNTGVLAYNNFPTQGSDQVLNSTFKSSWSSSFSSYRYMRNLVGHEHGHGLGAIHPVPCDGTKLMEPSLQTFTDALGIDELRFVQRNYGDRYAGNSSRATAANLGNLTTPVLRSVTEPNLSTNGRTTFDAGGNPSNATGVDWFTFTLDSQQTVTITVTPTGGSYLNQQQDVNAADICSNSSPPTVNAAQAGDLQLFLFDAAGTSVIASSASGGPGVAESVTQVLPAGTYSIRVHDGIASNPTANQRVQLYDLLVRVGASTTPPRAFAGLNKRAAANTRVFFVADALSRLFDGSTAAPINGYQWDLDGDGVTDTTLPRPFFTYTSSGVYTVTFTLTDNTGQSDRSSIQVTVTGGITSVASAAPATGQQGQTVPFTLTGNNFKTVTSASQVTVIPATGVTVTGTPVSNALGTSLSGLSLVIDPGAPTGPRSFQVVSSGSTGSGGTFTINPGVPCPTITLQPTDTAAYANLALTLQADATPAGATFQWYRGATLLPGQTSPTLSIPLAAAGDAGSYTVVATNACGTATSNAALVTVYCQADYNADGFANLDDLADMITDYYSAPAVPGGLQPAAMTYADRAIGYGIPCPGASDALSPFAPEAYRRYGYRVGFSPDGTNNCPALGPNLDMLADYITLYYGDQIGTCP